MKVSTAVAAFDDAGLWDVDAATSMTAWLKTQCGRSGVDAARLVSRSRRLHRLPVTAAAIADCSLSAGQVDAILANVRSRHLELFAAQEAALIPTLVGLSVDDTVEAMERWRDLAEQDDEIPPEPSREFHCSRTLAGRRVFKGHADGEAGGIVETAVRLATSKDTDGEPPRTAAEKRADALVDVCRFFLDFQQSRRGGRHRPHLNVILDLETLEDRGQGQLLDRTILGSSDVDRLLCDGSVHRVLLKNKSSILDYGTTVHTTPAPLFAALTVRDRHCRWPGCDRPPHWCEAHHIWHVRHEALSIRVG